jgi:hypothetical protein
MLILNFILAFKFITFIVPFFILVSIIYAKEYVNCKSIYMFCMFQKRFLIITLIIGIIYLSLLATFFIYHRFCHFIMMSHLYLTYN